jgi:hypothetical protein
LWKSGKNIECAHRKSAKTPHNQQLTACDSKSVQENPSSLFSSHYEKQREPIPDSPVSTCDFLPTISLHSSSE